MFVIANTTDQEHLAQMLVEKCVDHVKKKWIAGALDIWLTT